MTFQDIKDASKLLLMIVMSVVVVLLIIGGILTACDSYFKEEKEIDYNKDRLPMSFEVVHYKGHEYISRYYGGIIHSESCKCRESEEVK